MINKIVALLYRILNCCQSGEAGGRIDILVRIVLVGKSVKALPLQNRLYVGLGIDGVDNGLLETVAFTAVDIAGVLTVRTGVDGIQIILRVSVIPKELFTFKPQSGKLVP